MLRRSNLEKLKNASLDVLVVGAGINGAVSAAALAGRGARVGLIDRGDFAGFTSQESSNLAWGGIKYMETLEFGLVRNLCKSRNKLIRSYPSTAKEIRFLATIQRGFRFHPLFLYLGGWLYWLLGGGFTRVPRYLTTARISREEPIIDVQDASGGFEYSDAYLHDNDARFVWNFVRSSLNSGCLAANYVESLGARREAEGWVVRVRDVAGAAGEFEVRARVLINATGPFVDEHNDLTGQRTRHRHLLSKGIHLIVDQLSPHPRVLAFFDEDGRLFFVLPMGPKTCIGTTDTRVASPFTKITDEDRDFVLRNINQRLRLDRPLAKHDIIAERCGVRPLVVTGDGESDKDWTQLSRKHAIETDTSDCHISIFGGKLTDCLNVGEEISDQIEKLGVALPVPKYRWYGEPPIAVKDEFLHQARLMNLDGYTSPDSSEPLTTRFWRRYGAQAIDLLEKIREDATRAEVLIKGTEYTRAEIEQSARREMIVKLEDFLRRRSKIAQVADVETMRSSPGLMEACRVLFGDRAEERFDEYFSELQNEIAAAS